MVDVKWVKFEVGMYDDTKLKILDSMENRDLHHYVWTRSLVLAGKINRGGYLYITDNIPYTIKSLAIEFNRSVDEIKAAYKVLRKLEMIELTEDKSFRIKNWDKHQNVEGMERARQLNNDRVAKFRAKKKEFNEKNIEDKIDNDNCNVTFNGENDDSNVTVMEQNKKENKNEIENIDKDKNIELESYKNNTCEINNKNLISHEDESKSNYSEDNITKSQPDEGKDINHKALELMRYHEKITGKVGGCNYVALRSAIDIHGEKLVKMAMDVGFENNCPDIKYAIGILKNWRKDGYPKDYKEVKKNALRSDRKSDSADKNEFKGVKPKKPRNLTESERKGTEENLI